MNHLQSFLHMIIVRTIRVYKWIELQILLLFTPILKDKSKQALAKIGIALHCPGDEDKLIVSPRNKYNNIIRLKVTDNKYFARVANTGLLATGEAFMRNQLDLFDNNYEDLTEALTRISDNNLIDHYYHPWNVFLEWLELYAFNLQSGENVFKVGKEHYDLGNDLYELMLDPWMQYTCAYWKDAKNLDEAQINKLELISQKLDLKPGMRVLDIGCGFGTLCKYLAENYYGVTCVGITISVEQAKHARQICDGLSVEIRVQDYREVDEVFDRIVCVGMFEHVGYKNHRRFMQVANRCLKDDGIFLLHSIGRNHRTVHGTDPWLEKYIFPNGMLPSVVQVAEATEGLFIMEDWHNFSLDYAKTLHAWRENFLRGWPTLKGKYGDKFFRMWIYYLSSCKAYFNSRRAQLWQIVLSKDGLRTEYRAVR